MDWAEKIMREAIGNATGDADAVSRAAAALRDERTACAVAARRELQKAKVGSLADTVFHAIRSRNN